MTAIRESQSAPPPSNGAPNWSTRSAFGTNGVPLWGAVLLAAVLTAIGTVLDILIWAQPGMLFKSGFFVGCVLAVLLVKRQSVFGPMVQPPLVLTIVMPLLVLITGSGMTAGAGVTAKALAVARPLISSFPIMAGATIVALGIGLIRMFVTQRAGSRPEVAESDEAKKRRRPADPARKKPGEDVERRRPEERERRRQARAEGSARQQRAQTDRGRAQAPGRPRSGDTASRARGEAPGRARGEAPGRARGDASGRTRGDADRSRGEASGRARGESPGRARGGEGRPEHDGRAVPPRRGAAPRQAPGRPRPADPPQGEPPRRPRRPRRDEQFG
ncbi:DUF6542 domain-containing protein [Saccharopolyspora phatthalungensis]|uniref:DUF6542 domain-containing protein n=1 Tax=Saccharopolyspora phatthalungensis TaxID=664693 RepID=A0A840Q0F8_9PSEU|nr:DUF6542 domain-containing protein [Saccharopolyspora phatthalungensis]MBB5153460.1 hypothetical protein [Saccharopolyspora phatthalungensis]